MQRGQNAVHFIHDFGPLFGLQLRQGRVIEIPPRYMVHHIEGRSNNAFILAKQMHLGDWHLAARKRLLHAKLPIHRMGRFQQYTGGLAAQHIVMRRGREQKGRVRLPRLKLGHLQRPGKARKVRFQPPAYGHFV